MTIILRMANNTNNNDCRGIAIVGAGLSTAIRLERKDRHPLPTQQSQPRLRTHADLPAGGMLQQLGVLEQVAAVDCPSSMTFRGKSIKRLVKLSHAQHHRLQSAVVFVVVEEDTMNHRPWVQRADAVPAIAPLQSCHPHLSGLIHPARLRALEIPAPGRTDEWNSLRQVDDDAKFLRFVCYP